jgi:hypothetical protein
VVVRSPAAVKPAGEDDGNLERGKRSLREERETNGDNELDRSTSLYISD